MDHEGCWAQAGSSAQSSPCRICSLETRSMHGFGETSGSLINSLNLRLHSHSGVDDATTPIQGGAGGTTRQEREHSGVGGAGRLTDPERLLRSEGHTLPSGFSQRPRLTVSMPPTHRD